MPKPSDGRVRPKSTVLRYLLAALLAVALYAAGLVSYPLLFSSRESQLQGPLTQLQQQLAQLKELLNPMPRGVEKVNIEVSPDGDPQLGLADAPIALIEFSDFQCPYCKQFNEQTLPQLLKLYVETGRMRFYYRDFPLPFHANAQLAAEAAECANEQAAYWAMQDRLFRNQAEWAENPQAYDLFRLYAEALGLDGTRFAECLVSQRYTDEVNQDYQDGLAYGVNATPTFFINGYKLVGAQSLEVFQWVIETELKP
ncbi:MAG: hypothetical protein A2Z21_03350 [Candidatus Fraserbacteria bacterium RBG_16_55_9]|uniref:Thioredoxin domain-containing protein n=1 Tax=Fraserbacteria sp. (strain RBG_16_55_9) TaxID=1817864 RepID=A0A1F5UPH6_FRAXR|nr:MAG: hypothetical protein A2Z21_03350 [Candidatus Fraserbacteria bacterium RBG_16_55_9]